MILDEQPAITLSADTCSDGQASRMRVVGGHIWLLRGDHTVQIFHPLTMELEEDLSKRWSGQGIIDFLVLPSNDMLVATNEHLAVWKKGDCLLFTELGILAIGSTIRWRIAANCSE